MFFLADSIQHNQPLVVTPRFFLLSCTFDLVVQLLVEYVWHGMSQQSLYLVLKMAAFVWKAKRERTCYVMRVVVVK